MAEPVSIRSERLTALISPFGAELTSLIDDEDRQLMSDGDPAYWTGHAPLLFPIVGRLSGDTLRLDATCFEMEKHGFARKTAFDLIESRPDMAQFRLIDSAATRAQYPFSFQLDVVFTVQDLSLHMSVTVHNPANTDLPFSFGFHPAFAWPLPFGGARTDHQICFAHEEPEPLRAINGSGLITGYVPSPVNGRTFMLKDGLFECDALVWDKIASHGLSYGVPGRPRLAIEFPDTDYLGIWTKPGAAFVCIEPWAGIADDAGFIGSFTEKRGVEILSPKMSRRFQMKVSIEDT